MERKAQRIARGEPEKEDGTRVGGANDPHAVANVYSDLFYKAGIARDKGALALLIIDGDHVPEKELPEFNSRRRAPRLWISALSALPMRLTRLVCAEPPATGETTEPEAAVAIEEETAKTAPACSLK